MGCLESAGGSEDDDGPVTRPQKIAGDRIEGDTAKTRKAGVSTDHKDVM